MARKNRRQPITLEQVWEAILTLANKVHHMSKETEDLIAAVSAKGDVETSAIRLIEGVPAVVAAAVQKALADAGIDTKAINASVAAATADMQAQTDRLKAAVFAGTGTPDPSV